MSMQRSAGFAALVFALGIGAADFALAQTGQGTKAAPMPGVRSELQAVTIGGKIYVAGGNIVGVKDGKPDVIPDSDTWRDLAPVPRGANHTGIAALNGKIYIAGGFLGRGHTQSTDKMFVYDPATNRWQELAPLSSPRGAPALIALGGKIHAISGRIINADGAVPTHEVYDPATNKWAPAAPLPTARDHVGIAVVDGKIHVYAGRKSDAVKGKVGLHHIYDPGTDKWSEAAAMPIPVSSGTFAQYRGLLLYLGGECTDDNKTLKDVQAYDPKRDRWRMLARGPEGRAGNGGPGGATKSIAIGGSIGCGAEGLLADNLVFTIP